MCVMASMGVDPGHVRENSGRFLVLDLDELWIRCTLDTGGGLCAKLLSISRLEINCHQL